jgi:hypothetical protein
VAGIGLALLAALRSAHGAGLLHRDVKPANVLITNGGRVVLTDFGLATAPDEPSMTRTGIVLGSPSYIAPERLTDGATGPAADLWALGATLYAAVEGRPPYVRSSSMATLTAIVTDPPTSPERAGPLVPVLEGLLRKDPSRRIDAEEAERLLRQALAAQSSPASATETGAAVETWPRDKPIRNPSVPTVPPGGPAGPGGSAPTPAATPTTTAARNRKRWLIAAVLAVGLAVGVTVVRPLVGNAQDEAAREPAIGTPTSPPHPTVPGWHYYTQDPSFSIPVPDGWQQLRDGARAEFHELDKRRVLAVHALGAPKADLLAQARAAETADRRTGRYPRYERVSLREVDYRTRAVDREWSYTDAGVPMRAVSRTFVAENGQAYRIDWITPDSAWTAGQDALALVLAGFRAQQAQPAAGGASRSASPSRSGPPSPGASAGVGPPGSPRPTKSRTPEPPQFSNRPIVNNANGRCIDVPGNTPAATLPMQMWDCNGVGGQKFTLEADGTLRVWGGRCLEITGTGNGANLRLADCTGSSRQRFVLNQASDLVSLGPVKCVDVPGDNLGNAARLQIWDCNGGDNQKWHLG